MNVEFSASMMCARYGNLAEEVRQLEESGIDIFHIDIMDGCFVDNFGMGYQDMQFIRSATKKQVEMHLMIKEPLRYLPILLENHPDIIYIHPEADQDPASTLAKIKEAGVIAGIAINPGTSIAMIEELLNVVDRILILGVNPGHAGRKYMPYVGKKADKLLALREEYGYEVYWDGAADFDRLEEFIPKGVKGFVLGTALLFGHKESYAEKMKMIREKIEMFGRGMKNE